MEINTDLIDRINHALQELRKIVGEGVYDIDEVLKKMKLLTADLDTLNTIRKEAVIKYIEKRNRLYNELKDRQTMLADLSDQVSKYTEWARKLLEYSKRKQTPPAEFMDEGSHYKFTEAHSKRAHDFRIDERLIMEVLTDDMHIKLTKDRKKWLRRYDIMFRFKTTIIVLVKAVVAAIVVLLTEETLHVFFPLLPSYIGAILVAIGLAFSFDKRLTAKFNQIFWNRLRRQTLLLYAQFDLYLKHINLALEAMREIQTKSNN